MATIDSVSFKEKTALVRVDFNVPLNSANEVMDATRIHAAFPTIQRILEDGGKVVLMSHLGRPKGTRNPNFSLQPVASYLSKNLPYNVHFTNDCIGAEAKKEIKEAKYGEIVLLENLRFYNEEETGDLAFAKALADLGDVYVNDAFGTAHRAHASTAIIAQYFTQENKCFGYLMGAEVQSLEKALMADKHPIVAVIGGAKVSSKIDVLSNLLSLVDTIIIGGGMAYTFIKAQGGEVGKSLVEEDKLIVATELLEKAKIQNVKMLLPIDSVNNVSFEDTTPTSVSDIMSIPNNEMGLDIGPKTIETYREEILGAQTIIWNGPMGVFEMDNFSSGTKDIGEAMAQSTENGAFTLVGGGDSVAAAKKFNLDQRLSYISTGGGAMLEYLEGKVLPGIAAMNA
jgi:phosphoglycerate kinase